VSNNQIARTEAVLPLAERAVLVTRPEHQAEDFEQRITQVGGVPITIPAICLSPFKKEHPHGKALLKSLQEIEGFDWIIFTSVNGVDAVMAACTETETVEKIRHQVGIIAIGPATAARLQAHGISPQIVPDEFISDAIPSALDEIAGKRFLLPRADIARKWLPEELKRRGGAVTEVPTYGVIPNEDPAMVEKLKSISKPDFITVTSSSTVCGLHGLLEKAGCLSWLQEVPVVSIGPITSKTAKEFGARTVISASRYTTDGIIDAMIEYEAMKCREETHGESNE